MLKQTVAISALNLRSIPQRWGPSLVIIVGLAGVVAVFTALLAMAEGFQSTLQSTGRADIALVLRGGSSAELNSGLGREQATLIKQAPGVQPDAGGRPLASAEMMVIAELMKPGEKPGPTSPCVAWNPRPSHCARSCASSRAAVSSRDCAS